MNYKDQKIQSEQTTLDFCRFASQSPTCFHAVSNAAAMLEEAGFIKLPENRIWNPEYGKKYYVTRGDSSVIAFRLPDTKPGSFRIIASHSDSPSFKIKEDPEIEKAGHYVTLNVEKYGGALLSPWFDRPLGIAGRVITEDEKTIRSVLVNSPEDTVMIPSLAIHMNRSANEGTALKVQSDMLPVFGSIDSKGSFIKKAAHRAGADPEKILGMDLFLYDRSAPCIWGADREYFSSPRIDDLQCAFSSLKAITDHGPQTRGSDGNSPCGPWINMCCIFDNEEVGSLTKQGADSTFLQDVMERICLCLGIGRQEYLTMISSGFMLSADNSHAVHPNFADKADPTNRPFMNGGVVIKFNAQQKYTTDALSAGIFRTICRHAGVPVQTYFNHSDIPGGSTLGNLSAAHISMNCADIGCAQLAMHSPYETAGIKDTLYMIRAMKAFYDADIVCNADGSFAVNEK